MDFNQRIFCRTLQGLSKLAILACIVAAPVSQVRAQSLPYNINTSNKVYKYTHFYAQQPSNDVTLKIEVVDADNFNEGALIINGQEIATLFPEGIDSKDGQTTVESFRIPKGALKAGNNDVRIEYRNTRGFTIKKLTFEGGNTSTTDTADEVSEPDNTPANSGSLPVTISENQRVFNHSHNFLQKPASDVMLKMDVTDADNFGEADLFINSKKAATLFPDAKPEKDSNRSIETLNLSKDLFKTGSNDLRIEYQGTAGFTLHALEFNSAYAGNNSTPVSKPVENPVTSSAKQESLPYNVVQGKNPYTSVHYFSQKPNGNVTIKMEVDDADNFKEADLLINGRTVASLFPDAKDENDQERSTETIVVSGDAFKAGNNEIRIIYRSTKGFTLHDMTVSAGGQITTDTPIAKPTPAAPTPQPNKPIEQPKEVCEQVTTSGSGSVLVNDSSVKSYSASVQNVKPYDLGNYYQKLDISFDVYGMDKSSVGNKQDGKSIFFGIFSDTSADKSSTITSKSACEKGMDFVELRHNGPNHKANGTFKWIVKDCNGAHEVKHETYSSKVPFDKTAWKSIRIVIDDNNVDYYFDGKNIFGRTAKMSGVRQGFRHLYLGDVNYRGPNSKYAGPGPVSYRNLVVKTLGADSSTKTVCKKATENSGSFMPTSPDPKPAVPTESKNPEVVDNPVPTSTPEGGVNLGSKNVDTFGVAEWALKNTSINGNPYDLDATVTFKHISGETIKTGMFYDGNDIYRFRFNGSKPGKWTFTTSSSDQDLNGRRGEVNVANNAEGKGFVTVKNGFWARSNGEVFIPQLVMYREIDSIKVNNIDSELNNIMTGQGFNGLHLDSISGHWFSYGNRKLRDPAVKASDGNPDRKTFEVLETLIRKTYSKGGMVHFWQWGDNTDDRQLTLKDSVKEWGGNRGVVAKRLERYIAARLGALPGWTVGYGFDLFDWTNSSEVKDWNQYLQSNLGWNHLTSARGDKYDIDDGLREFTKDLPIASFESHRPTFVGEGGRDVAASCRVADKGKDRAGNRAMFMEDRFRVREGTRFDDKDYSADMTLRGMYLSATCGGFANIWGHLTNSPGGKNSNSEGTGRYPNASDLKRYADFIDGKMRSDMVRDDSLINAKYGYCMRSDSARAICYAEDVTPGSSLINLSKLGNKEVKYMKTDGGSGKGNYAISIGY